MARYIDAEQFRGKHVVVEIDGKLSSVIPYADIVYAPTADVAPKSEVERLERICNSYALQYGTVMDQQKVIDKAKTEVAREIFEEIEAIKCVGLLPSSWVTQFAELKKKYTGENNNA